MTHELTLNELVVESQYLLKSQSGKITKIPRLVTSSVFTCIGALGTPSQTGPLARKYLPRFP